MNVTESVRRSIVDQTKTYHVSTKVRGDQYTAYHNEPSYQEAMRRTASRSLADAITRDAGKLQVIEPTKEQLKQDPFAPVEYRWTVRIIMPGDLFDYFGQQIEDARAETKAEIIGRVRSLVDDALAKAENRQGIKLLMGYWLDSL